MKKNVVITGASRGIGLSLTKHYIANGWNVIATCRKASSELRSSGCSWIDNIDVTDEASIQQLSKSLDNTPIDILINNAGILQNETLGSISYESIKEQFEVNALGPLRISETLRSHYRENAKLVFITSRMGSISDNTSGGRYGYRMSKAALNIAAVSLAHDLRRDGIAVGIVHPGLVGTDMIGGNGDITPDTAAHRIVSRIDQLTLNNSGTFWHSNGETLPW